MLVIGGSGGVSCQYRCMSL